MKDGCWTMHLKQPKQRIYEVMLTQTTQISSAAFQILKILSELSKVFLEAADSS